MNANLRTLVIFFAGLAAVAALLVFGANWLLGRVPAEALPAPKPAGQSLPAADLPAAEPQPSEEPGASFRIQKGSVDRRPIVYSANGFAPARIAIQASDAIGCLITVVNRSERVLRVGVSPHDPAGDPGANYGEIAPGSSGILDVRYGGLDAITLHNHLVPTHEFTVAYGPGCSLR